jgi:hypothetical protein
MYLGRPVHHRQVEFPVAVEIRHRQRRGLVSANGIHRRLECSIAITKQDRDHIGVANGHRQVQLPVSIEIANHQRGGFRPGRVTRAAPESAIAISQ